MTTTTASQISFGETMAALDELAAAARSGEFDRYSRALEEAKRCGLTEEQMLDSYQWGRRGLGAATFTWTGQTR